MQYKKLITNAICPRCESAVETMDHLFQECPGCFPRIIFPCVDYFVARYGQSDQTVKINFDAAYDETSSQAALGIVVRNSEGKALISCSEIHHQIGSAFAAEALACRRVVQIGMEMKWSKIIIEGDSLSIIKKCKENREDKSHIGAYIHDIEQIMYRSRNLTFAYIPRVANMLAHLLAKESMKKREEIYLVDSFPEYAEFQRVNDSVREPD